MIDSNEFEAAVTRFVLTQWGYRVLYAPSIAKAREAVAPDLVLAYFPIDARQAQRVADAHGIPLIFVLQKHSAKTAAIRGTVLVDPPAWLLLDHLRVGCVAKRGPKPRVRSIAPQPAHLEVALL